MWCLTLAFQVNLRVRISCASSLLVIVTVIVTVLSTLSYPFPYPFLFPPFVSFQFKFQLKHTQKHHDFFLLLFDFSSFLVYQAKKKQVEANTTTCPICSNINTKYLHEQMPISLDTVLLELWQKTVKRFSFMSWLAKMLQWPAIVLSRMITSIPDDEDFSLLF